MDLLMATWAGLFSYMGYNPDGISSKELVNSEKATTFKRVITLLKLF